MEEAAAGIKGSAVLVQGDEKGVRIVIEDILGAVAVVAVGIDDGDFPYPVVTADIFDHDRLDIDDAKAAVAKNRLHGVMTWRADDGEGLFRLLFHDCPGGAQGAAGRDQV